MPQMAELAARLSLTLSDACLSPVPAELPLARHRRRRLDMPSRSARRKQRHRSEPPPSRPGDESSSESGDELETEDGKFPDAAGDGPKGLLNPQDRPGSIASKARAALDSHLRTPVSGGTGFAKVRTATASGASAPTVVFPLTPTSAAGEASDRTMASLTATATASRATDKNNNKNDDGAKSGVASQSAEDKMSQRSSINDLSAHSPPPDVPVRENKDPSTANTVRASASHAYTHVYTHANGSASSASAVPRTMSHRVENQVIRPRHFQDQQFHDNHYYSAHPSPPPITTLTHSPSLSSDRSSVNSPAPTILPPLNHPSQFQPQPYVASSAHRYHASAQPGAYHPSHYYPSTVSPPEVFTTPAQSYAHTYGGGYPPPPAQVPFHHGADMSQYSVNPYATTGSLYGHAGHGGGGSGGFTPIYTDDAATKLSDRVRRRCFNCCTTDTSTWRRSSLNPGKVLCNKCGLFERTHSRPRPDQFPHKRAPLQIPAQNVAHEVAAQANNSNHSSAPLNLPPTTGHPSLGATYSNPSALPQIQEWLRPNSNSAPGAANHTGTGSSTASPSASAGPSSRAHSSSSAADHRHHPYASGVGSGTGPGNGETRSPQSHSMRLTKRSNSVNSDSADTPPPQHRTAQNLTPSPSPPPEAAQSGGTASTQEASPRVTAQSVSAGAGAESGNQ